MRDRDHNRGGKADKNRDRYKKGDVDIRINMEKEIWMKTGVAIEIEL